MSRPASFRFLTAAVGLIFTIPGFAATPGKPPTAKTDVATYEAMPMVTRPNVSPDGKAVAFAWNGDIWIMPATGGLARRLTDNAADDSSPIFSPDGKTIAFASRRAGNVRQVFTMPVAGGAPRQITFHSEGSLPAAWFPDGRSLLTTGIRDQAPDNYKPATRFFRVNLEKREREVMLFDDYGANPSLSPDGSKLLFTREDHDLYRMGYRGSQASQIWLYDLEKKTFTPVLKSETGYRSPIWRPDGKGFYCLDGAEGAYNLSGYDFATGKLTPITHGKTDNIYSPAVGGDNGAIVFLRRFDLWSVKPEGGEPVKIAVGNLADTTRDDTVRRTLKSASEAAFSGDGLETFFVAGGDVWVMDATLGEPHAITATVAEESSVAPSPDGKSLFFLRDEGAGEDIFVAKRADEKKYWWENESFVVTPVTKDGRGKSDIRLSPDGKRLAFLRDRGDIVIANADGSGERVLLKSWNPPEYAWSPDGRWIAYAVEDDDFNRDIWIVPTDGSSAPVNVSRHPDPDMTPAWSPDGTTLAWIRKQGDDRMFLDFVRLDKERGQRSARDRKIEAAHEKMSKERVAKPVKKDAVKTKDTDDAEKNGDDTKPVEVKIDSDGLYRRVRRTLVPYSSTFDGTLVWTPDSKKVGWRGEIAGKAGIVGVTLADIEDKSEPGARPGSSEEDRTTAGEIIIHADLRRIRRLDKGKGYAGLTKDGQPAVLAAGKDAPTIEKFSARQEYDGAGRRRIAFLYAWRYMRDNFYDPALNNRDWNAVRAKYEDAAARAADNESFGRVVNMMLGELNASHLGYRATPPATDVSGEWKTATADLGIRFVDTFDGPGWRVASVVENSPADRIRSRVLAGETVLAVDGVPVKPKQDPTELLDGDPYRDVTIRVRAADGKERDVVLRPESFASVRKKARAELLRDRSSEVEKLSGGKLGYVYIAQMNWDSFRSFEKAVYEEGDGKDGLVIDVRDNGGGFTTDHLLTILCQPHHAITVPRDGGPGYPRDRSVYVTWNKPIVVLCNQNSFSNAEVFAHAVQNIGRGKLVGVRTAGAVISTGATRVLDFGTLRTPGRGWYGINDGLDYELNGAKPEFELWNKPGDRTDYQLRKAVEVLLGDVAARKPLPKPVNAHADGK